MADFSFEPSSEGGSAGSGKGGSEPGSGGATIPPSGSGGQPSSAPGSDAAQSATDGAIPIKRRRGRPPGSRSNAGPKPDAPASAANAGNKEGLDLTFKKNDRAKVLSNIAGIHMMAAILTKQPIMQLTEQEAKALTAAICDVADYHKISLDGAGGPFALYAALATTAYGIYVPRIVAVKMVRKGDTIVGVAPASPGEAKAQAQQAQGGYDFSGDIASTVN